MQQAQSNSNSAAHAFSANKSNESLLEMMTHALDEWNMIRYYQQLLEFENIDSDESIALLTDCYLKLSEPHRDDLELTLKAMHNAMHESITAI